MNELLQSYADGPLLSIGYINLWDLTKDGRIVRKNGRNCTYISAETKRRQKNFAVYNKKLAESILAEAEIKGTDENGKPLYVFPKQNKNNGDLWG